jgi:hypothetical protein
VQGHPGKVPHLRPQEWLPNNHLVVFLLDLPNPLDRAASMTPDLAKDPRGEIQRDPSDSNRVRLQAFLRLMGPAVDGGEAGAGG